MQESSRQALFDADVLKRGFVETGSRKRWNVKGKSSQIDGQSADAMCPAPDDGAAPAGFGTAWRGEAVVVSNR